MTKKAPVTIRAAANGWIVEPETNRNQVSSVDDMSVFNEFDRMAEFLANHFDVKKEE